MMTKLSNQTDEIKNSTILPLFSNPQQKKLLEKIVPLSVQPKIEKMKASSLFDLPTKLKQASNVIDLTVVSDNET